MKYTDSNNTLRDISKIHLFKDNSLKVISSIYTVINNVKVLVWTIMKMSGVFSTGIWMNTEAWKNDDVWKNEP